MTAAYPPSADGQVERTNQIDETALRSLLVGKYGEKWDSSIYIAQSNPGNSPGPCASRCLLCSRL